MAMVTPDNTSSQTSDFTVSEAIIGPLLATVVALEMVLALLANLFIVVCTLCVPRTLRKPSTIFLLNLALSNLIMSTLFMPFTVVTAGVGEWMAGANTAQKSGLCSFVGFVFSFSVSASVHTLAAISFDRFLFIVKPLRYRQIMTPWVTLLIALGINVIAVLFSITPLVGLGEYGFGPNTASCLVIFEGNNDYVIFVTVESTIPLGIILITSIWTFIFTRRFIRKSFKRQRGVSLQDDNSAQKSVYNNKLRNLLGIFGMLMIVNAISFLPFIVVSTVGIVVGFENIPPALYATMFTLFLLNNVTNPLVQSYFRRELWERVVALGKKVMVREVVLLFGERARMWLGLSGDRNNGSLMTTGANTPNDCIHHVQPGEPRVHAIALSGSVEKNDGTMELNMLSLPQQLEAENGTTCPITSLEEAELNLNMKNVAKIPQSYVDAGDKVVKEVKLENKDNSV